MFRLSVGRAIFLVALCLLGMSCLLATSMAAEKAPRAANLSLRDMSGKQVSLRKLRGHIVVLNFWATWCGPCNDEMPMLVKANEQYQKQGVVFLGASLDDSKSEAKIPAFLDRYHVDYAILTGASADDLAKLKMGVAIPATAFLDTRGIIRFRILGQMRAGELQNRIDWLLRESSHGGNGNVGPAPPAVVTHLEQK